MGIKLKFSTTFHSQTDGQIEVVNKPLRNLLVSRRENLKTWNLILPMTEFAYNSSVNKTRCLGPFEIVISFKPKQPIDLVPIACYHFRVSDSASAFASHIHALHEEIKEDNKT